MDIYSIIQDATYKTTYYPKREERMCIEDNYIPPKSRLPFTDKEYTLPPNIRKTHWVRLGNKLTALEHRVQDVPSDCYYSIRLDGKNFHSVIPRLVTLGLLKPGYSIEFDNMMQSLAEYLIVKCNAVHVYVQSDELTLLISPMVDRKTGQFVPHIYNGRRDKLVSIVSGFATQFLNRYISQLLADAWLDPNFLSPKYPDIIMDARIGIYKSYRDAFELILWRAYDCSMNAISTALYLNQLGESLENMSNTHRVHLLKQNNILSRMTEHQKYGTLLYREKTKPTNEPPSKENHEDNLSRTDSIYRERFKERTPKYSIVEIPGNVIINVKRGTITGVQPFSIEP
jgi:tRNA(His) 5'-end guanylyltransferase